MKKLYKRFIFLGLIFLITFSLVFVRFDAIASCVNLRINGLPGQRIVIRGNVICNDENDDGVIMKVIINVIVVILTHKISILPVFTDIIV